MASTKAILTSLHGKLIGLARDGKLVVAGRTALTADDVGVVLKPQGTAGTLNATGTLTAALIATGIVTSTTAAAVVATVATGTAMDTALASLVAIGDGFEWSAIATGANSFTVTAAADHTLVGAGLVPTVTSGRFFSQRTAANTWVTTRLA